MIIIKKFPVEFYKLGKINYFTSIVRIITSEGMYLVPRHTLPCVMFTEIGIKLQLVGQSPCALICVSRETLVRNCYARVIISRSEGGMDRTKVTLFVCQNEFLI